MIFANIAKTNFNLIAKRFIRKKVIMKSWPNDWVPFHWSRPEKISGYFGTGELEPFKTPSKEELLPDARGSKELDKLDTNDPVRMLYSLEHASITDFRSSLNSDQLTGLGLIHEIDYVNSPEARIIKLTYVLRQLQKHIEEEGVTNYNGHFRAAANLAANRRYRYLCRLKELHSDRYKRIIDALKIEPKENAINVPYFKPFRKKQMRKLAIEYSEELKKRKVREHVESIEAEKAAFEKEKLETLKWIEKMEQEIEDMSQISQSAES